jgi:hypothetical protein
MVYIYDPCDQISDFCHQQLLRKKTTKIILDGRKDGRTPIRFLLPVCRFCWFLYTFNIHLYMHIFCRIFLSNYWWQESDIWSQASYRYAILWEAFLEKNATKNERICSMCIKINKVGKQEVGIWWVQRSLWPNIRFLPSIVAEKNATKNVHICSMCIKTNFNYTPAPRRGRGVYCFTSVRPSVRPSFRPSKIILVVFFLSNCWWQKYDIWSQASYMPRTKDRGRAHVLLKGRTFLIH